MVVYLANWCSKIYIIYLLLAGTEIKVYPFFCESLVYNFRRYTTNTKWILNWRTNFKKQRQDTLVMKSTIIRALTRALVDVNGL